MATSSKKAGRPSSSSQSFPRPARPFSPTRRSRLQEKADLQNRLTRKVETSQETATVKSMYEHELSETKRLLDKTQREKARFEIATKHICDESEELKANLNKMRNDLTHKFNQAQADAKEFQEERDKLKKLVDELRKQLEEKSFARIDVGNNNQILKEEIAFKEQQLTETRSKRQYEAKLQETLQDLRHQFESRMANNRQESELLYEQKIKNLQNAASRTTTRIDGLNTRISELEKVLENERMRHAEELAILEDELSRMREEMALQLQEHQDLMNIKASLNFEIDTYRKLLEFGKAELNITPSGNTTVNSSVRSSTTRSGSARRTSVRLGTSGKRKRTLLKETQEFSNSDYSINSSSKGDINIVEVCPEGKFIKIHNKGNKEVAVGGWRILRKAGKTRAHFKIRKSVKVEANGTVTVWSSDSGEEHKPPHNIVMKCQKWVVADNMITTIINSNGDEMATSERVRRQQGMKNVDLCKP